MKRRSGFTLIELLVVVSIIAILMTLIVGVVGSFLDVARDHATKATLYKCQGLLNSRAQAFDRQLLRSGYLVATQEFTTYAKPYGLHDSNTQQMVARKFMETKYFPQSRADFQTAYGTAKMIPLYPKLAPGGTLFSPGTPPLTNEEIFYDFLTQENVIGGVPVGSDSFSASEVRDTNLNGLPEFIDGWGNPIRFYRWPTHLFRASTGAAIDPTAAKTLFASLPVFSGNLVNDLARDPDDPLQAATEIDKQLGSGTFEGLFHTPATFHVFLIVSAGPDGIFGMDSPDTGDPLGKVVRPANLDDDIIYLNIRAGGK